MYNVYFEYSLIFFIIALILNTIYLIKYSKRLNIGFSILLIIFAIGQAVMLNLQYVNYLLIDSQEATNMFEYADIILRLNFLYCIVCLIITIALLIIKATNVKKKSFVIIWSFFALLTLLILIFFKEIFITNSTIDFNFLSISLITYYFSLTIIPLHYNAYNYNHKKK